MQKFNCDGGATTTTIALACWLLGLGLVEWPNGQMANLAANATRLDSAS